MLELARTHGYTVDSSTLEAPWRASICGFSEPMQTTLANGEWPPEIAREPGTQSGILSEFSTNEARLHRQRGVPLDQYLGLTKYYRRAYLELVESHCLSGEDAARYKRFIDLFFDHAEVSICAEWQKQNTSVALTAAAQTNRQLTNEKNLYLTIFESLNEPVILLDEAGQVINLNLAASRLFDGEAVSGQGYYGDNGHRRQNMVVADLIDLAGDEPELEYQMETRRGTRTFSVKIQRMLDVSEKFTGTVIILSDITDFRAAQRAAEAANRAKSAFLATISHEVRTPINGILGIGQLLRKAPLSDAQTSYVDALLSSGELLLDLVTDILDYSKLEAGETELQPTIFSPRDMVERIARLSFGEAQRKGIEMIVDVSDDCPQFVRGDSGKVQRILLNLINNAVKFTQKGSVSISLQSVEEGLGFTVSDTGPGIPEADRDRVFEPFVQHHLDGIESPPGTGLGLAICRRLATVLGADLVLEEATNGGALFRLNCPILVVESESGVAQPESEPTRELDILLVEDNAINALVTEGFLENAGHRFDTVSSGEAALKKLATKPYDLILMDIRLQGMDGFQTIERIRESANGSIRTLPILVLTADQTDETARTFARSGANAFQTKPFTPIELRQAIDWALGSPPVNSDTVEKRFAREAPVLDLSVISEHLDVIGKKRTELIVATFLETATGYKTTLRDAAQSGQSDPMLNVVHTIKSAAAMTGLMQLAQSADSVERQISAGNEDVFLSKVSEMLSHQIDQGVAALRDWVEASS